MPRFLGQLYLILLRFLKTFQVRCKTHDCLLLHRLRILPSDFLEKTKIIESIYDGYASEEINLKDNKISFHKKTGDLIWNGKIFKFEPGQQKFNFLRKLFTSDEHQADFLTLSTAMKITISLTPNGEPEESTRRAVQGVLKKIKRDLNIIPKSKKSNPDIFKNIKNFGYKISLDSSRP